MSKDTEFDFKEITPGTAFGSARERDTSNDIEFDGPLSEFFSDGIKTTAQEHKQMGDTPLLSNGLNLLYSPSGYGKSYTSVEMAAKSGVPVKYIDLERNSQDFVNHCRKYGVEYLCIHSVFDMPLISFEDGHASYVIDRSTEYKLKKRCEDELQAIESIMAVEASADGFKGAVFILDSFSDIYQGMEQSSPIEVQNFMKYLHFIAIRYGITLLVIDHATKTEKSFKIEGNESAKRKKACMVLRLERNRSLRVDKSRNQAVHAEGDIITDYQTEPSKKKKYL